MKWIVFHYIRSLTFIAGFCHHNFEPHTYKTGDPFGSHRKCVRWRVGGRSLKKSNLTCVHWFFTFKSRKKIPCGASLHPFLHISSQQGSRGLKYSCQAGLIKSEKEQVGWSFWPFTMFFKVTTHIWKRRFSNNAFWESEYKNFVAKFEILHSKKILQKVPAHPAPLRKILHTPL